MRSGAAQCNGAVTYLSGILYRRTETFAVSGALSAAPRRRW